MWLWVWRRRRAALLWRLARRQAEHLEGDGAEAIASKTPPAKKIKVAPDAVKQRQDMTMMAEHPRGPFTLAVNRAQKRLHIVDSSYRVIGCGWLAPSS